jgi:putative tryptophan/tyrosine transport system substrate-binding protein
VTLQRRRLIAAGLAAAALSSIPSLLLAQNGQQRPFRIYMILYRGETGVEKGFRDYFASSGLAVEMIVRDVAQDISKVPELIAEARALQADLIYTWGTPVTLAVVGKKNAINPAVHVTDIPVVFTLVASPEGAGLVSSRTSSGRNITGASHVVPIDQQLGAIRAYRKLNNMAIIFNPAEPNSALNVKELQASAKRDGFRLIEQPIPLDDQKKPVEASLPELVEQVSVQGPQFLYLGPDSFIGANRKVVTESALAHRIPTFSATEIALREGKALFGLVSRYENVGRLTAYKAEQILLRKARPQDIPIETLARFSYIVNMAVATELDFFPPLKVVNYAEIIR